ncbi:MAG: hypothetical protein GY851_08295 [bacterium]|nr:hypothetical protein [bacterium]
MKRRPRPYIGMLFQCCHVYTRIYLSRDGTQFAGNCPKCGTRAVVKAGTGGSKSRFWSAE